MEARISPTCKTDKRMPALDAVVDVSFRKPTSIPHPQLWTLLAVAVLPLPQEDPLFSLSPKDMWVYRPHRQSTLGARQCPWLKGSFPTPGGCSHHTWVRTWLRNPFGNMASCPSRESLERENQEFTVAIWDLKSRWRLQRGQWFKLSQTQCLHIQNGLVIDTSKVCYKKHMDKGGKVFSYCAWFIASI